MEEMEEMEEWRVPGGEGVGQIAAGRGVG